MTIKHELVDIDDADAVRRAIEVVGKDGRARFLRRGDAVVAVLETPRQQHAPRRWARRLHATRHTQTAAQPFTMDDPLWELVGSFEGDGPTDVSENKHRHLAQAYEERKNALWDLVGTLDDETATDVSSNKHKYLDQVYTSEQE